MTLESVWWECNRKITYAFFYLTNFLYNEKKVHMGMQAEDKRGNVRDYCHDFTLQTIQELLQSVLVFCHFDIKLMNFIFHFRLYFF